MVVMVLPWRSLMNDPPKSLFVKNHLIAPLMSVKTVTTSLLEIGKWNVNANVSGIESANVNASAVENENEIA